MADAAATITLRAAPAAADSGAAAPAPVVVRIGAPVPRKEDQRYAARSEFGYAVIVGKYSVDRALEAALADLLAK